MKKIAPLIVLTLFFVTFVNAQGKGNKQVNSYFGNWSFGIGINIVDDSGTKLKDFFNTSDNWNLTSPYSVNIEYFIDNQFSLSASASMNKYVEGKNIDNTGLIIKDHEPDYLAVDLASKFYFGDIFTNYTFDPYVFLGVGYTKIGAYKSEPFEGTFPEDIDVIPDQLDGVAIDENGNFDVPEIGRVTLNGGVGFNYWFAKTVGFNFSFSGKIGMASGEFKTGPNSVSNQTQYSFGLIYFLRN